MKKAIIISVLSVISVIAFGQHRCSHGSSFQKSVISDTLDAISYSISMWDFDFGEEEFTAQTDVVIMSKSG